MASIFSLRVEMDVWELVSHSRICRVLDFSLRDSSAGRGRDVERVVAMIVLEGSAASWVVNSRPRPRFAPVITQVGIFEIVELCVCLKGIGVFLGCR